MSKFKILLLSIFLIPSVQATEVEIVSDIIALHQQDARRILGKEIILVFENRRSLNASVSYRVKGGNPILIYNSALLLDQYDDDVVTVVCHELGHLFGNRSFGGYDHTNGSMAYEGEADYFAGKCGVRYYMAKKGMSLSQAQSAIARAAQNTFQNLYKLKINPNVAKSIQFLGINNTYSSPDCRVLTVIHGSKDWARPSCWYNP